jgi:hypothetical protein
MYKICPDSKTCYTTHYWQNSKHGTAVAAVSKDGTCILKVYLVASNPNTKGQKNQRGKFGFEMKELNCFWRLFTLTFGGQYGINKAVSLAMKNTVKGVFPDFKMDYSQVRISEKELFQNFTLEKLTLNLALINLTWTPALFPAEHQNDAVSLVFLNPHSKQLFVAETIGLITNSTAWLEVPKFPFKTPLTLLGVQHEFKLYSNSKHLYRTSSHHIQFFH